MDFLFFFICLFLYILKMVIFFNSVLLVFLIMVLSCLFVMVLFVISVMLCVMDGYFGIVVYMRGFVFLVRSVCRLSLNIYVFLIFSFFFIVGCICLINLVSELFKRMFVVWLGCMFLCFDWINLIWFDIFN